jgi:hypothetical protein
LFKWQILCFYETAGTDARRSFTKQDLAFVPAVIDAPTNIEVQPHGKNKTSIVYSRDFGNGKIYYVERIFETSNEFEPRLTTKTEGALDRKMGSLPPGGRRAYAGAQDAF